jgi:hypothetical protein
LILQQGSQYKIKFSQEPRFIYPRPIIVWTEEGADEFPDRVTPLERAKTVTEKFNQHFIHNGSIKIPSLSIGIVNGQSAVCAASEGNCRAENVLWALKPDNQNSYITPSFF